MNRSFVKKISRKALIAAGKQVSERYRREVFHVSNMEKLAKDVAELGSQVMLDTIHAMMPVKGVLRHEGYLEVEVSRGKFVLIGLDGKEGFVFGQPNFSTGLAYCLQEETLISGVFNPYFKELFFAESNKPLKRNNQQVSVNEIAMLSDSFLGYSFRGAYDAKGQQLINTLFNLMRQPVRAMIPGSDLYGLSLVANGNLSGMIMAAPSIPTLLPGFLVVEQAGGKVTDENGDYPTGKGDFIIASNTLIHKEVLTQLNQILLLDGADHLK